jgi:hypothetical protein
MKIVNTGRGDKIWRKDDRKKERELMHAVSTSPERRHLQACRVPTYLGMHVKIPHKISLDS